MEDIDFRILGSGFPKIPLWGASHDTGSIFGAPIHGSYHKQGYDYRLSFDGSKPFLIQFRVGVHMF